MRANGQVAAVICEAPPATANGTIPPKIWRPTDAAVKRDILLPADIPAVRRIPGIIPITDLTMTGEKNLTTDPIPLTGGVRVPPTIRTDVPQSVEAEKRRWILRNRKTRAGLWLTLVLFHI